MGLAQVSPRFEDSPISEEYYAHLRDEALKKAADLAGDMVTAIASANDKEKEA